MVISVFVKEYTVYTKSIEALRPSSRPLTRSRAARRSSDLLKAIFNWYLLFILVIQKGMSPIRYSLRLAPLKSLLRPRVMPLS